ncbi:hypothetical protein CLAIMM_04976 isoform 1 [Cladophialophora immunda]|nr:hypothetical protein CLAIMM_04976 isoform 1 [Cladophialophora immunda]
MSLRRPNMRSWRKGVSMEQLKADKVQRLSNDSVQVVSSDGRPARRSCPRNSTEYAESVHWDYQVELQRHCWVPEIYESVAIPITVERIVKIPWDEETPRHKLIPKGSEPLSDDYLDCLMHFDFQIRTKLRVMTPRCPIFINYSKPAEYRYESDTGERLPSDHYSVCLFGNCTRQYLPKEPTIDFNKAVKEFYKATEGDATHNLVFLPCDLVLEEDILYPARMAAFEKRRGLRHDQRKMRDVRLDGRRKGLIKEVERLRELYAQLHREQETLLRFPISTSDETMGSAVPNGQSLPQRIEAVTREWNEAKHKLAEFEDHLRLVHEQDEKSDAEEEPRPAAIKQTPKPPRPNEVLEERPERPPPHEFVETWSTSGPGEVLVDRPVRRQEVHFGPSIVVEPARRFVAVRRRCRGVGKPSSRPSPGPSSWLFS